MNLFVNPNRKYSTINPNIYGHFAEHLGHCIYGGVFVGEASEIPNMRGIRCDVVQALRHIKAPVLRWPGGCFAEYYNWHDGIGTNRASMVNTAWGGVTEDNSFGTHEFLDFCEQVGCAPYIAGNIGSSTPRELSEWIEYITFAGQSPMADLRRANGREEPWDLQYIGIGNENWGCGGNMNPEYYADIYKHFATFARQYGDNPLYKIACGADGANFAWTETLMRKAGGHFDALSLHYYTMPGFYCSEEYPEDVKKPATNFDDGDYYRTLRRALFMDRLIAGHSFMMDRFDREKRVGLIIDEWGAWHAAEPGTNPAFLYQQNTMRDAVVAAVHLNIFNKHSGRVRMANLAQLCNVLQSIILTNGAELVLTPTYHVFDLFKGHQNATLIDSYVQQDTVGEDNSQVPALHVSASENSDGEVLVTIVNLSADAPQAVRCQLGNTQHHMASIRYIAGTPQRHNIFGKPVAVSIQSAPDIMIDDGVFTLDMPACCVMEVMLR